MPNLSSPYSALRTKAQAKPELVLLTAPPSAGLAYAPEGFRISYGEVLERSDRLAAQFAEAGFGAGDRVALLLQNRPEFFVYWLALNSIGASIVPINGDMRPDELRYQLEVSEAALIVHLPEFRPLVSEGAPEGLAAITAAETLPVRGRRSAAGGGRPEDECALLFTSGSTGKPKACILTNDYFMTLAHWYITQGGIAQMHEDCEVALTPLPMFHMNALGCTTVGMLVVGGAVVPLDRFHASRWWQTIVDSSATIVHCLGVIPAILLQLPETPLDQAHKVRFALGPGVDAQHKLIFERRFNLPIVEAWAMTETGGAAVTTTACDGYEPGKRCIGRPVTGMDYRIVDDAGNEQPAGVPGELLVRSKGPDPRKGFFAGYLNDETATEEAWSGGWFHTGDVVHADPAGLLYFFDRKKSIVRRSGENIAVLEVEAALLKDAAIRSVAVTPVPDDIRGEEVFAFVVRETASPGNDDTEAIEILQRAAAHLSYHKLPGYIGFVTRLPIGSTQKLQRGVLKTNACQMIEAGEAIDLCALKGKIRKAMPAAG